MFVPERFATAEFASIAFDMAPFAIDVALPMLVTTPVRLAFVVTVPAVRDAAVPVRPVPAPLNEEAVIIPDALSAPVIEVLLRSDMFPVVEPPRVNVCILVVANVPLPVMYRALFPEFAEMDAVGVPESTLMNANLADVVAIPPIRRSCVVLICASALPSADVVNQLVDVPDAHDPQLGTVPFEIRQVFAPPTVSFERVSVADA